MYTCKRAHTHAHLSACTHAYAHTHTNHTWLLGCMQVCPEVSVAYAMMRPYEDKTVYVWATTFCPQVVSLSYGNELRREEGCLDSRGQEGNTLTLRQCQLKLPSMQWKHDKVRSPPPCKFSVFFNLANLRLACPVQLYSNWIVRIHQIVSNCLWKVNTVLLRH